MDIMNKIPKKLSICTYDPVSMEYTHHKLTRLIAYVAVFATVCIMLGAITVGTADRIHIKSQIDYENVPVIIKQDLEFSEQKLWNLLVDMNVKFPHIVIAQARIESGHYTSPIFKENNNMFGMKCARARATTHKGENRNHAMFGSWQDCAIDYAFYQTTYMRKCKTEKQYLEALITTYAESGHSYGVSVLSESREVLEQYVATKNKR